MFGEVVTRLVRVDDRSTTAGSSQLIIPPPPKSPCLRFAFCPYGINENRNKDVAYNAHSHDLHDAAALLLSGLWQRRAPPENNRGQRGAPRKQTDNKHSSSYWDKASCGSRGRGARRCFWSRSEGGAPQTKAQAPRGMRTQLRHRSQRTRQQNIRVGGYARSLVEDFTTSVPASEVTEFWET